jgi:hypothetical protein
MDILHHESLGMITYEIYIEDDCKDAKIGNKFFQLMWEKYRLQDDNSKWRYPRREIFELLINRKSKESLYSSIVEEVKAELKEVT